MVTRRIKDYAGLRWTRETMLQKFCMGVADKTHAKLDHALDTCCKLLGRNFGTQLSQKTEFFSTSALLRPICNSLCYDVTIIRLQWLILCSSKPLAFLSISHPSLLLPHVFDLSNNSPY